MSISRYRAAGSSGGGASSLSDLDDLNTAGAAVGSLSALRRVSGGFELEEFTAGGDGETGDPDRWMLSAANLHVPYTSMTATSAQVYSVSTVEHTTPNYPITKIRFGFSNFYVKFGGETNPETDPGATLPIRAAYSLNGGTTWTSMTFGGAVEATLTDGQALRLADAITFGSPVRGQRIIIRTYRACANGQTVPATSRRTTAYVDGIAVENAAFFTATQADALALLAGGTLTNNAAGNSVYFYGPSVAVTDGWDGRPVALVVGDSIAFGPPIPCKSWIHKALDASDQTGRRMPYASFAVPGTRPGDQATTGAGQYRRRAEMITALAALNTGARPPFTFVLSEMGVNGSGLGLVAAMETWWAFLRTQFGVPVVQTSLTPRTTGATDKWVTTSGQTATEDDRWTLNTGLPGYVRAGTIAGYIDITAAVSGDPGRPHVWPVPNWHTTLAASCTSGATSVSMTDPPPLGWSITIDGTGGGTPDVIGPVNTVTGTGPYTVGLDYPTAAAHASGAPVQAVGTRDGTHPQIPVTTAMSDCEKTAKHVIEKISANAGSWA